MRLPAVCLTWLSAAVLCSACTIKHDIRPVAAHTERKICIIEDHKVREGFLETYKAAMLAKGYEVEVLPQQSGALRSCPLTSMYYGLWSWDMAIYLSYARIEIFRNGNRIGVAEYDARSGRANFGKFVKGEAKIRELVDKLFPDTVPTTAPAAR